MKFNLPIYYTIHKKKKANKTILVGMNWYRNAHYQESNEVKKHYHNLIKLKTHNQKPKEIISKYQVSYRLFYKNPATDMMNVVACIDKFMNDGLIKAGVVIDDNVGVYRKVTAEVGWQDRDTPRIEVEVKEME